MMRSVLLNLAWILCFLLTAGCEKALDLKAPLNDPETVYKQLWEAMDQKYALFSIKGVDWDSLYQATRAAVLPGLSETELFSKCSNLLEVLKDGHVSLISNDRVFTYENFFRSYPINFNLNNVITTYLQNNYTRLGPVIYKVVNDVAYLHYASFQQDITEEAVDIFYNSIATSKGLIIDVRSNNGGHLSNVIKLYSRLIAEKRVVKYEQFKRGPGRDDFYAREEFTIDPAGVRYSKPIVVLTNRGCFSACNDFVLFLSQLDNVTLVGDRTGGGGAVPANFILPNGWKLQYSSSITFSPGGYTVENGIAPDIEVNILPIQETLGRDPILEKAYELLQ